MGAGLLQAQRGTFNRCAYLRFYRQATARVQQQPDPEPAQRVDTRAQVVPGDVLVGQAHAVACIGLGQGLHHQCRIGHAARHGAGRAAGVRRVNRYPAQAGLEAENTAPTGWQAQRAANVRAQMQWPIAGGSSSPSARAGAARCFTQVPGVARQGMKT